MNHMFHPVLFKKNDIKTKIPFPRKAMIENILFRRADDFSLFRRRYRGTSAAKDIISAGFDLHKNDHTFRGFCDQVNFPIQAAIILCQYLITLGAKIFGCLNFICFT